MNRLRGRAALARHVVAPVGEIPAGGRKLVEVGERRIVVFNLGGEFFALRNRCPHQGGSLCNGIVTGHVSAPEPGVYRYERRGEMIRCPWHSWEFDIRTGQSWFDPARTRVARYNVTVEPADAEGDDAGAGEPPAPGLEPGPYMAETYPVSVERRNVVVEIGR